MKLSIAQTHPFKGDFDRNIAQHIQLAELAIGQRADLLVFPELSVSSYEPTLVAELATSPDDPRFEVFQQLSERGQMTIAIGVPLRQAEGISIGMVIFRPRQARQVYAKQHLHADEEPFFIRGHPTTFLIGPQANIAPAICYEISIPAHPAHAHSLGAEVYIASVVKSVGGTEKALITLADIARTYGMTVLMANCTGHCEDYACGGKSSVWDQKGHVRGKLGETETGILVYDTETQIAINCTIQ